MMQLLCHFAFTFLCSLSFFSAVLSLQCDDTQYSWPVIDSKFCCNKCPPGKALARRLNTECQTECKTCEDDHYADTYNVELYCKHCTSCNKPNMEYMSACNSTHDSVCRCKAGYECREQPCKMCVPIPITTKPTTTPTTTATPSTTPKTSSSTTVLTDTAWFLVIIILLSVILSFFGITKMKPFLHWIRSKHGYLLAKTPAPMPPFQEDDSVSKPVQEVCGKCDQPLDV
ncbi:tumor necrosis factor receptor superfamily member 6 [Dicentrarchus labrax]|uniref:tumor necrosis factor receptor superfamily member 6 n=1 Tax=Dicentrarchus labrax TaxID=13489 RepID=UPI0021F5BB76|nr:tumor necrosis factor receptor superfamily member 6 [Dicentrarchus labrax]XP_051262145.1 tumor necrosis factor receptor superfamily member 6 [Dicentrarchus labrax]